MAVQASPTGVVTGKFTIPAGVPAGTKQVAFVGAGGSKGGANFVGSGVITDELRRQLTTLTTTFWQVDPAPSSPPVNNPNPVDQDFWAFMAGLADRDPLAQTFSIAETCQIGAVDLWFAAVGTHPVQIQIRPTQSGFPTRAVVGEVRIAASDINLTGHTRVTFASPIQLLAGTEYAIVAMCDDAITSLKMAELGKYDIVNDRWVTSQPYNVGVLLSSSNAITWTAHQDRDMAFRLHKAVFTEVNKSISLGSVAVVSATDLVLSALQETPSSSTRVSYDLGLPDGSTVNVSAGQPVRLAAPITGNVSITAKLTGSAGSAPVLLPGAQLIVGAVAQTGNYVSRSIPAGSNVRVKAVFEANIPAGAAVGVKYKGVDVGDVWADVPYVSSTASGDGFMEMTHELTGVTETMVQIQLNLSGTTAARPRVRNVRFMVI